MTYKLKEFGDALRQHIAQQLQNPFEDAAPIKSRWPTSSAGGKPEVRSREHAAEASAKVPPSEAKRKRGRPRKGEKREKK